MDKITINLKCNSCGSSWAVPLSLVGNAGACPFCGVIIEKNDFIKTIDEQIKEQSTTAYARYVYDRDFNTPEKQKERAEYILNSNAPLERKLEDLAYNPFSKRDIVKYIIENGMLLENVFYPDRMLDEQGNDFRDFIESDNNFYFGAIETLLEQIDVKSIKNIETKKLIEKCTRAVDMWNDLNDLYCALPIEDVDMDDFENFYDLALKHIIACGEYYFKRSKSSKNYYIEGQNEYLIETLCEALNPYQAMGFKEYCQNLKNTR